MSMKLPVGTLAIGSWPRKKTSAKVPLSARKTTAALAKKTGHETVIDRWYRSVQNPLFNPRVMISRLPILTMLDREFFEIRRNGCIDLLPARSNDLWTDLVTASQTTPFAASRLRGRRPQHRSERAPQRLPLSVATGLCSAG